MKTEKTAADVINGNICGCFEFIKNDNASHCLRFSWIVLIIPAKSDKMLFDIYFRSMFMETTFIIYDQCFIADNQEGVMNSEKD